MFEFLKEVATVVGFLVIAVCVLIPWSIGIRYIADEMR